VYDDDTGLVRFGARDYDAYSGRWTAKDPVLFNGGDENLYVYAFHDPVNYADKTGRFANFVGGALAGALVGGVWGAAVKAVAVASAGGSAEDIANAAAKGAIIGAAVGGLTGALAAGLGPLAASSTKLAGGQRALFEVGLLEGFANAKLAGAGGAFFAALTHATPASGDGSLPCQ